MKRILVTGASGLLGLNFCSFYCRKYDVVGISNKTRLFGLPFSMISRDLLHEDPGDLLTELSPDIVLHCAAMANIDQCQKNPEEAAAINCHMGFSRGEDSAESISGSFRYSPLAWLIHVADEASTFLLDRKEPG